MSTVRPIPAALARSTVVLYHYLHRAPPVSYAFGLFEPWRGQECGTLTGVVIFGVPASRHLQKSACPSDPDLVLELNRLWISDTMPRNTASWFLARALRMLPPRIIVSYADTAHGHHGWVYRAANFHYAGWTDMDRRTPRFDYMPKSGGHTRDAFRTGWTHRVRRQPKIKYWTVTGNPTERRHLTALCGWPRLDWHTTSLDP